jgi:predicted RNA-binding Zn-ribbon protein involved in translation (DUF1610 family)
MAGPSVIRHQRTVACGTEYQEGGHGVVLECACGTFAIGRCAECKNPVCGLHSEIYEWKRLCDADVAAWRTEAERVAAAARARATAAAVRPWREWQERLLDELGDAHPIERLARVMTLLSTDEIWLSKLWKQRELVSTLEVVLRDLWSTDLMKRPPWDHEQVLEWFLSAVKVPPAPHKIFTRRKVPVFGELKAKLVVVPGWTFASGSTSYILTDNWHFPVTVLVDGRRGSYLDRPDYAPGNPGFSGMALREMATLAQLPALPPRPSVR